MKKLNYITLGNPAHPPILLLHGLFGSYNNIRSLGKKLENNFYVYLIDLRNHGQSFWDDAMDYLSMAKDIEDFIKTLNIQNLSLLGHSMGGKVTMTLGLFHTLEENFRPKQLIILDISPIKYQLGMGTYSQIIQSFDLSSINSRQQADEAFLPLIPDASIRNFLLQSLRMNDDKTFQWRFNINALHKKIDEISDFPDASTPCNIPTLFIQGGASDYYIPKRDRPLIEKLFPNSTIHIIEKASHWIHIDALDEIFPIIETIFQHTS